MVETVELRAPFPWFGGKSRVAPIVWERFGDVSNYVEPFAGSLAVLLMRPTPPRIETVNDLDCYLSNFWRATARDPEGVAAAADYPVNEADLHARHLWLVNQVEFRERMKTDPDFYDSKIAGWWVWGISQWIGSGWCSRPNSDRAGVHRKIPNLGHGDISVHRKRPATGGSNAGRGVHRKRMNLGGHSSGSGINADAVSSALHEYFEDLRKRLRRVRVCCGDWSRVLGPSVTIKQGVCGVFLDPPYDMRVVSSPESGRDEAAPTDKIYTHHDNDVSAAVRTWAIENGSNPLLRIALCGYEGEHDMPADWEVVHWKSAGGYSSQGKNGSENRTRERLWFSPACIRQNMLF